MGINSFKSWTNTFFEGRISDQEKLALSKWHDQEKHLENAAPDLEDVEISIKHNIDRRINAEEQPALARNGKTRCDKARLFS